MLDCLNSLLWRYCHVQLWLYVRAKGARSPHTYCTNALQFGDVWRHWRNGGVIWFRMR